MKKNLYLIALLAIACVFPALSQQKATGLSGMKLYIDPGHYGTYNLGYGDYSEAEKVLVIAHQLKEYLVTYTDMLPENIQLSRLVDGDGELAFQRKADLAAAMGAHMFYSIHSDAPSTTSFSSLLLYGGRRTSTGATPIEKLPEGGKQFGDILVNDLTSVLRAIRNNGDVRPDNSRGNMNDLVFYGSSSLTPYLAVNRTTAGTTASLLSEAGFHTNPAQNMQFVNVEHKHMQAYSAYQSIVKYFSDKHLGGAVAPVQVGIATGFVFDNETFAPVNGAVITVTEGTTEKTYTTDTYASLPKKYKFKPDEFGNGFYWIEGFTPGATVDIKVEATGFQTQQTTLTIPATIGATTIDGLGVKDFQLLNQMPAKVRNVSIMPDLSGKVIQRYPMDIIFDRKMDRASVEAALDFSPTATVSYSWVNDFTLRVDITQLAFETDYTLTIDGGVAKNSETGNFLDGAGDGTEGSDYVMNFSTADADNDPPVIVSYDPQGDQEINARPVVRIEFDEMLNELSIGHTPITVTDSEGTPVDGSHTYYATSNFKSVIHFIFDGDLEPQETYTVTLNAGIEDMYGNATPDPFTFDFTARPRKINRTQVINTFGNPAGDGWWQPGASGTTTGVNTEVSLMSVSNNVAYSVNSTSMRMDYLWTSPTGVIRLHRRGDPTFTKYPNTTIQFYLFGDGSNTRFRVSVRAGSTDGSGTIWSSIPAPIDWVGWKLISWDLHNNSLGEIWLAGDGPIADGTRIDVKEFGFHPANPIYDVQSYILIDELVAVELGDFIPGNQVGLPAFSTAGDIDVYAENGYIQVKSANAIDAVQVYSITGALLQSAQPAQTSCQIPTGNLAKGVYVVKVAAGASQVNAKVIVK